jgi:hypothetical protein
LNSTKEDEDIEIKLQNLAETAKKNYIKNIPAFDRF